MRQYASYVATGSQWLDSIPAHWKMGRLDHAARAWPSNVDKHSVEGELPVRLCNYTDVYKNDVIADGIPFMSATATAEQVERFRIKIGDTIITKDSETADDIGIPAFVDYEADDLVCGYHLSIVRPDPAGFFPKYLFWALRAQPTLGQWEVLASGVTRVGLRSGDVSKAALALPPIDEQRAIADYLDRETARIDTLIGEQQRLIETLRERRGATIAHTVTRGIDPNAEMKQSGVDWLGPVPRYWAVRQLKWGCPVKRGASPRPIDDPKYFDEEGYWSWVRIADVSASGGHLYETTQRLSELGSSLSVKLDPGSLFVSIAGTVGKPCINHIPVCIHDGFVYFPALDMDVEYLFRIFEAGECYRGLGKLGTQLNLNTDTIGSISMPIPPLDEQRRIVAYLDEQTAKIDTLIAETGTFIELARERRSALITAAVTGQIDVRGAA